MNLEENSKQDTLPKPSKLNILLNAILKSGSAIFLMLYTYSFLSSYFLTAELLCHFQVFYFGCALFGLILGFALKKYIYVIVHAIVCAFILYLILPFYFSSEIPGKNKPTLKIYQANVEAKNDKYDLVVEQIDSINPDIVLLIETGRDWNVVAQKIFINYPYQYKLLSGPFGYIFGSKFPIISVDLKDFDTSYECLDILLNWNGKKIRFIGAHPPPPIDGSCYLARNTHFIKYAELIEQQKDLPTIICGDLNVTPWSNSYRMLIQKGKLKSTRQGHGLLASWPNSLPYRIPIDHCLVTNHFGYSDTKLMPSVNSDHLPMVNEVYIKE